MLEPARESRGSHGSLGATSGSTEPREGAGPCGWRRRPRPRRSAGPREASPSAWPPLALAVLPNPAHGSGTVPSPARTCVVCCLLMTSSLSPSAAWCARSLLHSALQEKATDLLHLHNVFLLGTDGLCRFSDCNLRVVGNKRNECSGADADI